jgi:hypothetical protein
MQADGIAPGMRVRYPRTGTTGIVQRIETLHGTAYAELDSTHLLYLIDHLIPADSTEKPGHAVATEDAKKVIAREREFAAGSELQEALKNIDQSCEGGG